MSFTKQATCHFERWLGNVGIEYTTKRSRTSRSTYYDLSIGKRQYKIRISDHKPSIFAYDVDFSVFPQSEFTLKDVKRFLHRKLEKHRQCQRIASGN